jgi:hypothetical protein
MEITIKHTNTQTQTSFDERLFHSILPRYKSSDQQITFPKAHAATAVAMITGLVPFVIHDKKMVQQQRPGMLPRFQVGRQIRHMHHARRQDSPRRALQSPLVDARHSYRNRRSSQPRTLPPRWA